MRVEHIGPATLYHGDCLAVLRTLPNASVDSIVTDPPYGLAFMGKKWDYDVPSVEVWAECLRVLKPGGHLLAFAGTRTQHRMAVRIEDAGFEIRDLIAWVYGSGFPKSRNLDGDWQGWGTALKPALEPITVARKPLVGTVAENVLAHGTGALNIDGCRVGAESTRRPINNIRVHGGADGAYVGHVGSRPCDGRIGGSDAGRWPANLIHDGSEEVLRAFPQAKGQQGAVGPQHGPKSSVNAYGDYGPRALTEPRGDTGSAARFFKSLSHSEKDLWAGIELPPLDASTAVSNSLQQRQSAVSALALVVRGALPEGLHCEAPLVEPSMSATASELRLIAEAVTTAMPSIVSAFLLGRQQERLSLTLSPVSVVAQRMPTGITTITASLSKSDGYAVSITFSIMPSYLVAGAKDCEPSPGRFMYCAKASKRDRDEGREGFAKVSGGMVSNTSGRHITRRDEGYKVTPRANNHPTVKPTDLMRYLCRLVTPPGGVVLDPFMGSGSTGKAAVLEGFRFIGIEREAEYVEIAKARIDAAKRVEEMPAMLDLFEGVA